jgi:hypothetical protein
MMRRSRVYVNTRRWLPWQGQCHGLLMSQLLGPFPMTDEEEGYREDDDDQTENRTYYYADNPSSGSSFQGGSLNRHSERS